MYAQCHNDYTSLYNNSMRYRNIIINNRLLHISVTCMLKFMDDNLKLHVVDKSYCELQTTVDNVMFRVII